MKTSYLYFVFSSYILENICNFINYLLQDASLTKSHDWQQELATRTRKYISFFVLDLYINVNSSDCQINKVNEEIIHPLLTRIILGKNCLVHLYSIK